MCFSATANFVGSGVLGVVGAVTLTKVKHKRELLFAALPTLFAIHQFIEGFVWLGLDGILSPAVAHDMGAAFMLYAQGLLPFLLPLSVFLFEPDRKSRGRMLPFLVLGGATTLYILWALTAFPLQLDIKGNSIVYINQATNNTAGCGVLCDCHLWVAIFLEDPDDGNLRRGEPGDPAGGHGVQAVRVHLTVVRVRGGRQCDHPRLLREKPRRPAVPLRIERVAHHFWDREPGAPLLAVFARGERLTSRFGPRTTAKMQTPHLVRANLLKVSLARKVRSRWRILNFPFLTLGGERSLR
jgi:hypothetical protein